MTSAPSGNVLRSSDEFRSVWISQAAGMLGASIMTVAASLAVLDRGGTAGIVAATLAGRSVGMFVGFLTLGGLSTYFSPRGLMVLTDLVRVGSTATVALGIVSGHFWLSIAAVVVTGLAESVFMPCARALLPLILAKGDLLSANSISAVTRNVVAVAGPALAGLLVLVADPIWGVLVNCGCFALSALALARVRAVRPEGTRPPLTLKSYVSSLTDGARALRDTTWLWAFMIAGAFQMFLAVGAWSVLLPIVTSNSAWGESSFGLVLSAYAVGGLAGGLLAGRLRSGRTAVIASAAISLFGLGLVGLSQPSLLVCLVLCFFAGSGIQLGNVLFETLVQQKINPAVIARVTSIMMLPSTFVLPASYLVVGLLAESVDLSVLLFAGAAGGCIVMGAFISLPTVRHLELEQ
ncbi:MFS transporter [Microbacterium sp.]|uniref:MFS transporter n=1 Tax=Microbacterium sp. TaxID=51671 RepID=UPI00356380F2